MSQHIKHVYNSWNDFIEKMTKGQKVTSNKSSESVDREGWYGTNTFREAVGYLNSGWHDGLRAINERRKHVPADLFSAIMPVEDYMPELRHVIAGGTVDIPAHITGATPEVFIAEVQSEETREKRGNKLKTLYVNCANNSNIEVGMFMERGSLVWLLVEHMEKCGFSCEVWAYSCHSKGSWRDEGSSKVTQLIKVKEFGELFDDNKLAIALCSAFMLRRFVFALMEMGDNSLETDMVEDNSYGTILRQKADDIILPSDKDLNPLFIDPSGCHNPDQMRQLIKKVLDDHLNTNVLAE